MKKKQKNNKNETIPSAGPSITHDETALVTEAVREGWYEDRNKHFDQFVKEFSAYTGATYCLPVSHCTDAIHLALLSLGIGRGDEVIVPDITWVASVAPIHYVGATPIFVDIDERSWCLSPRAFERAITKKTKAVVVVDLYGHMPAMDEIRAIARFHHISIIEDAAEAMGAKYKDQNAGTFGTVNVFSFNATKVMMSGQGGMFTTNNKRLYERAKRLAHHGMIKYTDKTTFWSVEIGYNYQWTNIQAALALAQLRRIDELVVQRRRIFSLYEKELASIPDIRLNPQDPEVYSTYWVVTVLVGRRYKLNKEQLMKALSTYHIDTRPFFYPVSLMPAYRFYVRGKNMMRVNPVAYDLSSRGISLPSAAILNQAHIKHVCRIFKTILREKLRKN